MSLYLFKRVKEKLQPDNRNRLRLYCAIGSRLDFFHGVDGFFELDKAIFTFDLTISRESEGKRSVDMMIRHRKEIRKFFWQSSVWISKLLEHRASGGRDDE